MKINDAAIRNLRRSEIRVEARTVQKKRRWEWTRCRPLLIAMAIVVFLVYLKWAGFVK